MAAFEKDIHTYTTYTSGKHLWNHVTSALILPGLCCDVIITGECGDPNNRMHAEVTASNTSMAYKLHTNIKFIYLPERHGTVVWEKH